MILWVTLILISRVGMRVEMSVGNLTSRLLQKRIEWHSCQNMVVHMQCGGRCTAAIRGVKIDLQLSGIMGPSTRMHHMPVQYIWSLSNRNNNFCSVDAFKCQNLGCTRCTIQMHYALYHPYKLIDSKHRQNGGDPSSKSDIVPQSGSDRPVAGTMDFA